MNDLKQAPRTVLTEIIRLTRQTRSDLMNVGCDENVCKSATRAFGCPVWSFPAQLTQSLAEFVQGSLVKFRGVGLLLVR
jgi:hypothetical protein